MPWGSLRGLAWGNPDAPMILAVHGWLDNAASFNELAPMLAHEWYLVALDLPGHGASDHRPAGETYELLDHVRDIAVLLSQQQREGITFVGHSLGGILGALLAAACPERVGRLVMIDSLGPVVGRAEDFPGQLGKALRKITRGARGEAPVYGSPEEAVEARLGGRIPLSRAAAEHIVPRNLIQDGQRWVWRTDPRLRYPSMHRLEEEEVLAMFRAIQCPVLVAKACQGLMDFMGEIIQPRFEALADGSLCAFEGGHHFHLDGDVVGLAEEIKRWLDGADLD